MQSPVPCTADHPGCQAVPEAWACTSGGLWELRCAHHGNILQDDWADPYPTSTIVHRPGASILENIVTLRFGSAAAPARFYSSRLPTVACPCPHLACWSPSISLLPHILRHTGQEKGGGGEAAGNGPDVRADHQAAQSPSRWARQDEMSAAAACTAVGWCNPCMCVLCPCRRGPQVHRVRVLQARTVHQGLQVQVQPRPECGEEGEGRCCFINRAASILPAIGNKEPWLQPACGCNSNNTWAACLLTLLQAAKIDLFTDKRDVRNEEPEEGEVRSMLLPVPPCCSQLLDRVVGVSPGELGGRRALMLMLRHEFLQYSAL